jgi:cilia- and flagella-associated protein 52
LVDKQHAWHYLWQRNVLIQVSIVQVASSGAVKMLASMKDHKAAVNAIAVSPRTGAEAVSASSDGCCIIWDLATMKRRTSFYSNTFFKSVSYHPDESQV